MSRWLVTQGSNQFSVEGLDELEEMARNGQLAAGDMIQPPGTTEWLYVSEVPELEAELRKLGLDDSDDLDDIGYRSSGASLATVAAVVLGAIIVLGGGAMAYYATQLTPDDPDLFASMSYSQMIVTAQGSGLRPEPDERARLEQPLSKDTVLELLSKRGDWYRAQVAGGREGWIPSGDVIPMYLVAGAEVREQLDPLYNPDRYVQVVNARWMPLAAEGARPGEPTNLTVFEFMMKNQSTYEMTGLVIEATIKDAKGHELETVEIDVDGVIPAEGHTTVGTLTANEDAANPEPEERLTSASFDALAKADPDLYMRWKDGVEVLMSTPGTFTNAEIAIVELRAVPDEEAAQVVRRE